MDILNNLMMGFGVALTLNNILYCFIGVLLGTLIVGLLLYQRVESEAQS